MPETRLASAEWEAPAVVSERYPFAKGKFWLGRNKENSPIGYRDDRHICLVSGNRGGKGTSVIVNNLCFWPGSAVVIDPKGENATVTSARRGGGNKYCTGLGQAVAVLDPFRAAEVDESYRSSFNPFDALDPNSKETIDEADRLANAIVVVKDASADPFWDESARDMVRGLILHVLTAPHFLPEERNLITLRSLVLRGDWQLAEDIRADGHDEEQIEQPHLLLWRRMERNPAFNGLIAGIGSRFRNMMKSDKQFEGILQSVSMNTRFIDSPPMQECLAKSEFKLSELKTRPKGMTLYLSLPQRYMDSHHRWLRMMVVLITTQMEITRGNPATGHPVLIILDEFAGLNRMESIEKSVAQIAGFGVKLFFVLQSLEQLKGTYKDHWETFLANAGLKIFFSIEDHFTRDYVSKLVGDTEIIRKMKSENQSQGENESRSDGHSQTETASESKTEGASSSHADTTSKSTNESRTSGVNSSFSHNDGYSFDLGWFGGRYVTSRNNSSGYSGGYSSSTSDGSTDGTGTSDTTGKTHSDTLSASKATGTTQTKTYGSSQTKGTGENETVHRRPLIQPDEIGRFFTRCDDKSNPAYPGLALVLATGANPLVVRRTHYFEDLRFIGCFSPHPDHTFLPPTAYTVGGIRPLIDKLEAARGNRLTIAKWLITTGNVAELEDPHRVAATIKHVPPDNRTVSIYIPYSGKVTQTAAVPENRLPSGDYAIPSCPLFTIKNYSNAAQKFSGIDPFSELRAALNDLEKYEQAARGRAEALRQRPWRWPSAPQWRADWLRDVVAFCKSRLKLTAIWFVIGLAINVAVSEFWAFKESGHPTNPLNELWVLFSVPLMGIVAVNLFISFFGDDRN